MSSALDQFLNFERNLEATINSPHFYDFKKVWQNGGTYTPGATGTIGVLVFYPVSNIASQDTITGIISAVLVGNLTLTPRATAAQFADITSGGVLAPVVVNIWGHTQPFFIPGDFENIVSSSDYIRYMVVTRELRQYEQ